MIWLNLLFYTAITFVAIFVCTPRAKFWDPLLPVEWRNIDTVNIVTSVINATSDIVLLLLPIITTAFNSSGRSSGRGKSNDISASTERSGHVWSPRAQYQKSPYGDTESYVELDERQHHLKSIDSSKAGPRVWSDEVFASDEEKAQPPIDEDGITKVMRH